MWSGEKGNGKWVLFPGDTPDPSVRVYRYNYGGRGFRGEVLADAS